MIGLSGLGAAVSDVTLNPSTNTVSPGETFTVDVFVTPDSAIAGMQFNIEFDDSKLELEGVTEGNLLTQSGRSTFFYPGFTDFRLLKNVYGCILGSSSVSAPGDFATITLKASENAAGTLTLDLKNVVLSDSRGNALNVDVTGANIEVSSGAGISSTFDPMNYDIDSDNRISSTELSFAYNDYYKQMITQSELMDVIKTYFNSK